MTLIAMIDSVDHFWQYKFHCVWRSGRWISYTVKCILVQGADKLLAPRAASKSSHLLSKWMRFQAGCRSLPRSPLQCRGVIAWISTWQSAPVLLWCVTRLPYTTVCRKCGWSLVTRVQF